MHFQVFFLIIFKISLFSRLKIWWVERKLLQIFSASHISYKIHLEEKKYVSNEEATKLLRQFLFMNGNKRRKKVKNWQSLTKLRWLAQLPKFWFGLNLANFPSWWWQLTNLRSWTNYGKRESQKYKRCVPSYNLPHLWLWKQFLLFPSLSSFKSKFMDFFVQLKNKT